MFKAYRVRLPGLIAFLATALMPVVLHSAVGSGGTSGKIFVDSRNVDWDMDERKQHHNWY